jgi:hypothetical protein
LFNVAADLSAQNIGRDTDVITVLLMYGSTLWMSLSPAKCTVSGMLCHCWLGGVAA